MNPYDEDFEPQQRKSAPLFIPKQVRVDQKAAQAQMQPGVTPAHRTRYQMTFYVVQQPYIVQQAAAQNNFMEVQQLYQAKLVGNYPQQLPFADNQNKALYLSCQRSKYVQPAGAKQGEIENSEDAAAQPFVLADTFLLQLPALLPQNQSYFQLMDNCQFGVLQRHKSGKMTMRTLNGVEYRLIEGADFSYQQKAMLIDVGERVVQEVGDIQKKYVACLRFE